MRIQADAKVGGSIGKVTNREPNLFWFLTSTLSSRNAGYQLRRLMKNRFIQAVSTQPIHFAAAVGSGQKPFNQLQASVTSDSVRNCRGCHSSVPQW